MADYQSEKMIKDRGDWQYTEGSPDNRVGAVQQQWVNKKTGVQVQYWANMGGNGPQEKTLNKYASWKK